MGPWTKLVVALLVTLPIGGYVAGTLIANAPAEQGPRPPVLLREATPTPGASPGTTQERPADPTPTPTPSTPRPTQEAPADADGDVRVVTPAPTRVGDDDGGGGDDDAGEDGDDSRDDTSEGGDD